MTDPHGGLECKCGPRLIHVHGFDIEIHRPITTSSNAPRRKIWGLPRGWVIVGSKAGVSMSEADRQREIKEFEARARARRAKARGRDRDAQRD